MTVLDPCALPVPVYQLYGEATGGIDPEFLHCEPIALRSRRHCWQISPHRHQSLFQVLFVASGDAAVLHDDRGSRRRGPFGVIMPAPSIHGFRFDEDVEGWVLSVAAPSLSRLLADAPEIAVGLAQPAVIAFGERAHDVRTLFARF